MGRAGDLMTNFRDHWIGAADYITISAAEFYPDALPDAAELYQPVIDTFGDLAWAVDSSEELFTEINRYTKDDRIQLCRIFRKYVSPGTPVEMLKRKYAQAAILRDFGGAFKPIEHVREAFGSRPVPDEALCAVLWEYKDRGKKGYDLTEQFFDLMHQQHPELLVTGPRRAGRDIRLGEILEEYTKLDRPIDFLIYKGDRLLAVGLARYDSDRGGAQEDDRIGQYREVADEFFRYADNNGMEGARMLFINDGPGLLLGSMWEDYSRLEDFWDGRAMVATLKMLELRLTQEWLGV